MQKETTSHDHKLFSRMTDILVTQGTGKHSYRVDIESLGTLAVVMNQQGDTNKIATLPQMLFITEAARHYEAI